MPNIFDQFDEPKGNVFDQFDDLPQQTQSTAQPDQQKMEWSDALKTAFKNIPESSFEFGKNIVQPILHPVKTATALGETIGGGVAKLIPGEQPQEKAFDNMVDFFKNRYGSVENFKQTISKDPVGFVADLASVLIPGGEALRAVGATSKLEKIAQAGNIVSKVGSAIEPISAATKTIGGVTKALIPTKMASKMYQSSVKFSTVMSKEERAKLATMALDYEIMPTYKGLDKLRTNINALNEQVTEYIEAAYKSDAKMEPKDLFRYFDEIKEEARLSGRPKSAIKSIDNIKKQITEMNPEKLTPIEVQKLKQNIYKETGSFYGMNKFSPWNIKAQHAAARSAKEFLEEIYPEIKGVNRTEGDMIKLEKALQRSAARIENRDLIGIGVPIKGTLGGVLEGTSGAIGGLLLGIIDTPKVKARLAIITNKLKKRGVKISPTSAAIRLGLVQLGRNEEINSGK